MLFFCFSFGTQGFTLKPFIVPIVFLLDDPIDAVIDAAIQTLVEIYKHFGEYNWVLMRCTDKADSEEVCHKVHFFR